MTSEINKNEFPTKYNHSTVFHPCI